MTKKTEFTAGRAALVAVLSALALCSFVVENLFPPLFLPGAKLGLGNAFSLFALIVLGPIDGIVVAVIRTTLGSLIVGNMSTLLYSLTAGLADIYMSGAEGECEFVYDPANRNEHLSGNVYYYSETSAANSWRYVDGVATKW